MNGPTSTRNDSSAALITLPCIHCGEPTECPTGTRNDEVFCCRGCLGAYQLIHGLGLADFYALRDQARLSGTAQPASQSARYDQFDEPDYLGSSTPQAAADGTWTTTLALQGLHCAACAWLIESAASHEPGLLSARVRMSDHTIKLVFDPTTTKLSRIARLLDRLGYQATPFDPARDDHLQRQNRQLLIQIAVAGFLAANAMWIAIALYAGGTATEYGYFLGLMGSSLGLLSVVFPGRTFFVGAWSSLKTRTPHMDLPVALGLSVGAGVGTLNAVLGRGHVYFDSIATLVFLLLIGRWIQFHQQQRAAKAVDLMLRITPKHASQIQADGTGRRVLSETLVPGDLIEVATGECVPADGLLARSPIGPTTASLNCSLLTGESQPVELTEGDAVAAGVVNLGPPIRIEVSAVGSESRIGRVMQSVELATTERTPIVLLADRIGGYFVVVVTLLAIFAFIWWLPAGLGLATAHATSLLIVACPCALALATPLGIAVGLGRAAKRGVLIRDGNTLQQLARPGVMWFDKTGTLTAGQQRVTSVIGDERALVSAAALERQCQHPVASAIIREAKLRGLDYNALASQVTDTGNGGMSGTVDGQSIVVGNLQYLQAASLTLTPETLKNVERLAEEGQSPVLVALNGDVVLVLGLADPVREGAAELIGQLQRAGWKIGMLSGDHPAIAQQVGQTLGIPDKDCFGGLTPEEKLAAIKQSRQASTTVVMVGDGANDAAALAAADVGIAVRGGAEVSLQAAPVFVSSGQLTTLWELVEGSRRTQLLIAATFAISLAYNAVAVGLALAGYISPLAAAILMPISSISVLAVTLGVRTFRSV